MGGLQLKILAIALFLATVVIAAVGVFSARQLSVRIVRSGDAAPQVARTVMQRDAARWATKLRPHDPVNPWITADATLATLPHPRETVTLIAGSRVVASTLPPLRGGTVERIGDDLVLTSPASAPLHASHRDAMMLRLSNPARAGIIDPHGRTAGEVVVVPAAGDFAHPPGSFVSPLPSPLPNVVAIGLVAFGASAIAAFVLSLWIAVPIRRVTNAAAAIAAGERDVVVNVRGHDEVARLAAAFTVMANNLRTSEQRRRDLVADIAHELRTPLNNLQGEIEAIRDGLAIADDARMASLHEETRRLASLVDDLAEMSVADGGGRRIGLQPLPVAELVNGSVSATRIPRLAKGVTIDVDLEPGVPFVLGDADAIRRVLANILINAIRHVRAAGWIGITVRAAGDAAEFRIADDGDGIPPADLENVFERFYRVDKSRDRSTGGSGLGLAIARQLIDAHGGRIWAENNERGGATFAFTLPLAGSAG